MVFDDDDDDDDDDGDDDDDDDDDDACGWLYLFGTRPESYHESKGLHGCVAFLQGTECT